MGQRLKVPGLDEPEKVLLADFQRWLNSIEQEEPAKFGHRDVVEMLKDYDVPIEKKTEGKKRSWFHFRMSDLQRRQPILANAFRRGATKAAEFRELARATGA